MLSLLVLIAAMLGLLLILKAISWADVQAAAVSIFAVLALITMVSAAFIFINKSSKSE